MPCPLGPRRSRWPAPLRSAVVPWLATGWIAAAAATGQPPQLVSDFSPATVVATVDGEPLELGELLLRYATLPQHQRHRYASRPEGLKDFLADTVANLLVAREAKRLGVEEDPLFPLLTKIREEEVLRDLYARRTVLAPIDEATVRARYEAGKERAFEPEPRLRARHILATPVAESTPPNASGDDAVGATAARAKIEEIHRRLTTGGEDFAELARLRSEDVSAAGGGDLGWVQEGELVPVLWKTALSLAPGEISPVIESELGFHVVQVTERRPGGLVPYELVRELLFQELVGERAVYFAESARRDRERLVEEHAVEIFAERLPW